LAGNKSLRQDHTIRICSDRPVNIFGSCIDSAKADRIPLSSQMAWTALNYKLLSPELPKVTKHLSCLWREYRLIFDGNIPSSSLGYSGPTICTLFRPSPVVA
jgi:hypothetical protein